MTNRHRLVGISAAALLIAALTTVSLLPARGQATLGALPVIADWAWKDGRSGSVGSIVASPDGRYVLSGHYETSILWDVQANRGLTALRGHEGSVYGAFLGDGRRAVTASSKREVFVWEIPSGRKLGSWVAAGDDVRRLTASPDGRRIALGHDDLTLRVWDVETGKLAWSQSRLRGWITGMAYTSDGKLLVTGQQSMVSIWDAATGASIAQIETNDGQVWTRRLARQPPAAMGDIGTVMIIDLAGRRSPHHPPPAERRVA